MFPRIAAAASFALAIFASCAWGAAPAAAKRPNIVLLFIDDLGWADLGYRNPIFETPNIDRLAKQGVDFEQAYVNCPTCSASRTALLTGRYAARFQMLRHVPSGHRELGFDEQGRTEREFHNWPGDPAQAPSRNWLPKEPVTYAAALKELGYYTLHVGKWHLGHEPYYPVEQGFNAQLGVSNFGLPDRYYPPYFKSSNPFPRETDRYLTDKLTDEAVRFIECNDRAEPFLLSFWHYAVHFPNEGPRQLVRHFELKGLSRELAQYAAMVKSMDESVGRVRAALAKKGIEQNTVIIFLSDQGGYFQNGPLRGGKNADSLCEGGCRVPFIVYWPGVSQAGKNRTVVQSLDVFPTLVEIAGGDPKKYADLDGLSLVPAIRHNRPLDRTAPIVIYLAYEDQYAAVRQGDWKLIAYRSGRLELYHLADDLGEKHDLAKTQPAKVKELAASLLAWEKDVGLGKYSGVK